MRCIRGAEEPAAGVFEVIIILIISLASKNRRVWLGCQNEDFEIRLKFENDTKFEKLKLQLNFDKLNYYIKL